MLNIRCQAGNSNGNLLWLLQCIASCTIPYLHRCNCSASQKPYTAAQQVFVQTKGRSILCMLSLRMCNKAFVIETTRLTRNIRVRLAIDASCQDAKWRCTCPHCNTRHNTVTRCKVAYLDCDSSSLGEVTVFGSSRCQARFVDLGYAARRHRLLSKLIKHLFYCATASSVDLWYQGVTSVSVCILGNCGTLCRSGSVSQC